MRQYLDQTLGDDVQRLSLGSLPLSSRFSGSSNGNPQTPPSAQQVSPPLPFRPDCSPPNRTTLQPAPVVGTATLEATSVSLAHQIEVFAKRVMAQGIRQVVLVPLFLLAGVHVKDDLPREIATAKRSLPSDLQLICAPHLGSFPGFKRFMVSRLSMTTADRCLLLAHGSRRPAGNRSVQQLGAVLDADVAFWSIPPDLETQVIHLMQQGYQQIAIAPYFLFPGGITDAMTQRTEELAERLPQVSLRLLAPLGLTAELGKVVAALALSASSRVPMPAWESGQRRIAKSKSGITA